MFQRIMLAFELKRVPGAGIETKRWLQLSSHWTRVVTVDMIKSTWSLEKPGGTDADIF